MNMFLALAFAASSAFGVTNNNGGNTKCDAQEDIQITAQVDLDRIGNSELNGSITNGSDDEYQNVQVKVDFYDDMNNHISSQMFTINEDLDPGETENFDLTFRAPDKARSAKWSVACTESDDSDSDAIESDVPMTTPGKE